MTFKYRLKKEWLSIIIVILLEVLVIYFNKYFLGFIPIYLFLMRFRLNYTQEIKGGTLSMGTYKEGVTVDLACLDHLLVYDHVLWRLFGLEYAITIEGIDYTLTRNLFNDEGKRLADVLMNDYGLQVKKGKLNWGLYKKIK